MEDPPEKPPDHLQASHMWPELHWDDKPFRVLKISVHSAIVISLMILSTWADRSGQTV